MTTQQKPAPAVGQRWKWNDERSESPFVLEPDGTYGHLAGAYEGGGRTGWFEASYLTAHGTYLGPLPGKAGVEGWAHWVIGSRWQQWNIADAVYRVVGISPDAKATLVWERGPGDEVEQCLPCLFEVGRWQFRGFASPPTGGVIHGTGGCSVHCTREVHVAPVRDGASGASDGIMPQNYKIVGIDWGAGVPVKREVSTNGRDWLPYDTLTDADPFTSYRHRREGGVVALATADETTWCGLCGDAVASRDRDARGYCWRCHKERDTDDRYNTDESSRRRSAANPVVAPPSPIDPTPGAGIPERRAYRTPSGKS